MGYNIVRVSNHFATFLLPALCGLLQTQSWANNETGYGRQYVNLTNYGLTGLELMGFMMKTLPEICLIGFGSIEYVDMLETMVI